MAVEKEQRLSALEREVEAGRVRKDALAAQYQRVGLGKLSELLYGRRGMR